MFNYDPMSVPPGGQGHGASHPNPMFDYLTTFTPRRLKDLLRAAEYIGVNSAHIYGTVRKFGEYPITRLEYETNTEAVRKSHENLFDRDLRMKGFLTKVSFDVWLTGNSLVSLYEPIQRNLTCTKCRTVENIVVADYQFHLDKLEFRINCRGCQAKNIRAEHKDIPLRDSKKMRLKRWDPKLIDIDSNTITGETEYYYTIPRSEISKVRSGSKLHINHTPMEMLSAMRDRKVFKFHPDAIYHMRMPAPAGLDMEWGLPPITAAIKLFMFAATLRRANEAIALEHITPFRVMHPASASQVGDPLTSLNLSRWRQELEQNLRAHRRDPLRVMFAPIPVGVQNIGGDGRAMLTLGELQEAEKSIVLSLGVPIEFLTGGLSVRNGDTTLRMIENQLRTHIENLNGLIQWVESRATTFLQQESCPTKLADFKMIDDIEGKQLRLQMWSQKKVSDQTMASTVDLDLEYESRQIRQEALKAAKDDAETQMAVQKQQAALSITSRQQAAQAQGGSMYDPQAILAANAPLAEELMGYDEGTRRSRMDALQGEDPVAYAVVRMLLEQGQQDQVAQMKQQQRGGA